MGHEGKNHSELEHVCGGCQEKCQRFLPDNTTFVPMCQKCWGSLTLIQRMMVIASFRQADQLSMITGTLRAS
jgi:hypothetical protein